MKKYLILIPLAFLFFLAPKAHASFSIVQSATSTCATTSCATNISPTAGNALLVHFVYRPDTASISSVKDSSGATLTQLYDAQTIAAHYGDAWYCETGIASGISSVTVTFSAVNANAGIIVEEASGINGCTLDGIATSTASVTVSPFTTASITPTAGQSDVLFCAAMSDNTSGDPAFSYSAGFTAVTEARNINDSSYAGDANQAIASASGSYSCTLTFTPGGGNAVAQIFALKQAPGTPQIASFAASPSMIYPGSTSTLSWTISGATSASIDQGIGSVATSTGSSVVSPTVTTTYTLSANNANGTSTASTTVQVISPTINSFSNSAQPFVCLGNAVTLSWNVSGDASDTIDHGVGQVATGTGTYIFTPTTTITFTFSANNSIGTTTATTVVNTAKCRVQISNGRMSNVTL